MSNYMKAAAVLFAFLVAIFFMLAPVVAGNEEYGRSSDSANMNGGLLMTLCSWPVLPAVFAAIMAMCVLLLPGKTAGIICAACAFVPLLTYFFILGIDQFKFAVEGAREMKAPSPIVMGYGTILSMVSGFICAALCFFSDNSPAKSRPAPGPGPSPTSEW